MCSSDLVRSLAEAGKEEVRPFAEAGKGESGKEEKERPYGVQPKVDMKDRELIQLICAYRLLDEEVELSLSTRESPVFRDHAIRLGITAMSAGSRTNPGGYMVDPESLEQFEIHDDRSPAVVAEMIRRQGYEAVWKDWDPVLQG